MSLRVGLFVSWQNINQFLFIISIRILIKDEQNYLILGMLLINKEKGN